MSLFEKFGIKGVAVIDFETTGLNPEKDYPTEVAIKKVSYSNAKPCIDNYSSKIKLPEGVEVPKFITELTGLTTQEVNETGSDIMEVIPKVQNLIDSETLVIAHNANFDLGFLFNHMGIEPAHFMCTRTISILTEPNKNASLKNVFARMFGEKEQTHRASNDVEMTMDIFEEFIKAHGNDGLMYFSNKMVSMPDRGLVFTPHNANVLDFTRQYVSKKTMMKKVGAVSDKLQEVANELDQLKLVRQGL